MLLKKRSTDAKLPVSLVTGASGFVGRLSLMRSRTMQLICDEIDDVYEILWRREA